MVGHIRILIPVLSILLFNPQNSALNVWDVMSFARNSVVSIGSSITESFVPGTLWCGPGNRSESYDQLGFEREIDECCRAHDSCQDYIISGETKYNLTNESAYTILDCECDDKFRDCLHSVKSLSGSSLGRGYFDVAEIKCFKKDYPVIDCNKYSRVFLLYKHKCLEYVYDTSKPKIYQLFDIKAY